MAKPTISLISTFLLASQSMALYGGLIENYTEGGQNYTESTITGSDSIAALGQKLYQSTDSCVDKTGYENSDGLSISWRSWVATKFQIAPITTVTNTTSVAITVNWSLVSGVGYDNWTGNSSGKLYHRDRFKDQYNVTQNPD